MKPEKKVFTNILGNQSEKFEIPYFQRAYVWQLANWEAWYETLEDLVTSSQLSTNVFIGSMILKLAVRGQLGKANSFLVIDGQQRFTTALIFLKTCMDIEPTLKTEFDKYFKYDEHGTKRIKLENSHSDKEMFEKILVATSPSDIDDKLDEEMPFVLGEKKSRKKYTSRHNLLQAYWYFSKKIKDYISTSNLSNVAQTFFYATLERLEIISIELDDAENEQQIFDTINSLGVQLTTSEICKNDIFMKYKQIDPKNVMTCYQEYWKSIFEEDNLQFWNSSIIVGRLSRTHLDSLLHTFLVIKSSPQGNYIKHEKLLEGYKKFLNYIKTKKEIEELLSEIKIYAKAYRSLMDHPDNLNYDDYVHRMMFLVDKLDTKTIIPLLVFIVTKINSETEQKKGEEILRPLFKSLECYIVRRHLNQDDEKSYTRLFTAWIKELANKPIERWMEILNTEIGSSQHSNTSSRRYPNNEEMLSITNNLYKTKNRAMAGILFIVELYLRRSTGIQSISALPFLPKMTLEHIIPQTYSANWADTIRNSEEEKIIHSIGNFTLVKQGLNSSMSNKNWSDKYTKLNEFAHDYKINGDILTCEKPTIETIKSRSKILAEQIIEIWSF